MIQAIEYCAQCGIALETILLTHKYNDKESAALPKQCCPKCKILELSGDDIDFFIYGGKPEDKLPTLPKFNNS